MKKSLFNVTGLLAVASAHAEPQTATLIVNSASPMSWKPSTRCWLSDLNGAIPLTALGLPSITPIQAHHG